MGKRKKRKKKDLFHQIIRKYALKSKKIGCFTFMLIELESQICQR